ncbi:hypothetical protein ACWOA0_08405 [Ignavigranum ruoffiae]|uniref:hypothetical protein n=1 Tax=Ignavigranum ruoffiae TaxID=89093 RepID=UPI003B0048A6
MNTEEKNELMMAVAIVNQANDRKFIKQATKYGLAGGISIPAEGLVSSSLLKLMGIRKEKRKMILLFERKNRLMPILNQLVKDFKMDQANHGIIFLLSANFKLDSHSNLSDNDWQEPSLSNQLILATYRHQRRQDFIDHFQSYQPPGGTLFTGISLIKEEISRVLGLEQAPQKDLLLSVMPKTKVSEVFKGLEHQFQISQSKGMRLYSFDVDQFSKDITKDKERTPVLMDKSLSLLVAIITDPLFETLTDLLDELQIHGGTLLHGRGILKKEAIEHYFRIPINPEKFIFFIIDTKEQTDRIFTRIQEHPKLMSAHQGVYFTLPIQQAFGLHQRNHNK